MLETSSLKKINHSMSLRPREWTFLTVISEVDKLKLILLKTSTMNNYVGQ